MKKLMLILFMFLGISVFSQEFKYKIKINSVNNIEEAKAITDPLRYMFKCYPTFNDSTDYFEFTSNIDVTKKEITLLLAKNGYLIYSFEKSKKAEIINDEIKE